MGTHIYTDIMYREGGGERERKGKTRGWRAGEWRGEESEER